MTLKKQKDSLLRIYARVIKTKVDFTEPKPLPKPIPFNKSEEWIDYIVNQKKELTQLLAGIDLDLFKEELGEIGYKGKSAPHHLDEFVDICNTIRKAHLDIMYSYADYSSAAQSFSSEKETGLVHWFSKTFSTEPARKRFEKKLNTFVKIIDDIVFTYSKLLRIVDELSSHYVPIDNLQSLPEGEVPVCEPLINCEKQIDNLQSHPEGEVPVCEPLSNCEKPIDNLQSLPEKEGNQESDESSEESYNLKTQNNFRTPEEWKSFEELLKEEGRLDSNMNGIIDKKTFAIKSYIRYFEEFLSYENPIDNQIVCKASPVELVKILKETVNIVVEDKYCQQQMVTNKRDDKKRELNRTKIFYICNPKPKE